MKKIIHIEDVDIVYKQVREALYDWFGETNIEIQNLEFEKAAENFIDRANTESVALIIIDLMVAYDPDENVDIPETVLLEGSFDAGFRLIHRLRASPTWQRVPIVIYSSVDKGLVEDGLKERGMSDIGVVQKTHTLIPLMTLIQSVAGLRRLER